MRTAGALRNEMVHARLNKFEVGLLRRLCAADHVNLSEAIRLAIREAARVRGLWTAGDEAAEEE